MLPVRLFNLADKMKPTCPWRIWRKSLLGAAFGFGISLSTVAHATVICEKLSCLDARDVNGIHLGMTVKEVAALLPSGLTPLGAGQFSAQDGNQAYDFGFSALGHLYRIDSHLNLGNFQPDRRFELNLAGKLAKKYGPPEIGDVPSGVLWWTFAERYQLNNGTVLTRETESLSASLGGGFGQPTTLDIKLMDFRILRQDLETLNRQPEMTAAARIRF